MTFAEVAEWGLQTGLVVSLLIGLVLIIRRPFARYFGAGAAYALWLLPAIRLFLPTMTVPFLRRPAPPPLAETGALTPFDLTPTVKITNDPSIISDPAVLIGSPNGAILPSGESVVASDPVTNFDPSSVFEASLADPNTTSDLLSTLSGLSIWTIGAIIWLSVAVLWFAFQLIRQRAFMDRMRRDSVPAGDSLAAPIEQAQGALRLRRLPDIRLSDSVSGPMVTGVSRPLIFLPHDFETRFNEQQQVFALVHEMAHIKRGDLWVALATLSFRALFWPNPLVHFAAHKMRVDQEAACDASVVATTGGEAATHSYAETLVHAAKSAHPSRPNVPLGLALSETKINDPHLEGDQK